MPSPATLRNTAPRLVWLATSSITTPRRAPASTRAADRVGSRPKEASTPRCTWKPVVAWSTSKEATCTGQPRSSSRGSSSARRCGESSSDRAGKPAAAARSTTFSPSAMKKPDSRSCRIRRTASVRPT